MNYRSGAPYSYQDWLRDIRVELDIPPGGSEAYLRDKAKYDKIRTKKVNKKVVIGAADTFRAAAVDQIKIWGERVGVQIIEQGMNADPAAVAYDTLKSAIAQNADVVIIDTAGRLHNKVNLMNELNKIKRVMQKKVLNELSKQILAGMVAKDAQIVLDVFNKEFVFRNPIETDLKKLD
jgi:signal recognition particle GTPase